MISYDTGAKARYPTFGMKVYKRPYKDDDQFLDL